LGLHDRYDRITKEVEEGWDDNIMAVWGKPVEEKNIDDVLSARGPGGVIRAGSGKNESEPSVPGSIIGENNSWKKNR
jgi:hypothetical protein